jgi:hypothetical protein
MNYQQVADMIRATAEAVVNGGIYVNAVGGIKNASEYYNSPSPQIFTVRLSSQRDSTKNVRIWNSQILFITQDRPETNEAEREAIKAAMDVLSIAFENYMTSNYKVTCTVTDNPEDKILAGTYSGWFGTFTITTLKQC